LDRVAPFYDKVADESLRDGLAPFVAAALDLGFEFFSEGFDVGVGRWVAVGFFGGFGQFGVARAQRSDFVAEVADAGAEHVLGDRSGFEGVCCTVR
jgi:hypothetical protein